MLKFRLFAAVLICLALAPALPARATDDTAARPPAVNVKRSGDALAIDVDFTAAVPLATAWDVLTDFSHMASFVPNLTASEAIAEAPNVVRVKQQGVARWGFLNFDFVSERRITLQPMSRIDSTTLAGKISKMHSICTLRQAEDGVAVHYHADAVIDFFLPPVLGLAAIRHEMEEQFTAMLAEMHRRQTKH